MREIVHLQAGQCGNQIGSKVASFFNRINIHIFIQSSGKLSLMNMVLTQLEHILVNLTLNYNVSMYTTMRLLAVNMYLELF